MTDVLDAQDVLDQEAQKFPPITVDKEDNLQYHLGDLLAFDLSPLDVNEFRQRGEDYLREIARDDVQLMFNKIFSLPTSVETGLQGVLAKLPKNTYIVPREKHIPKPKPETRWEKFAKEKGIKNRKKDRMVRDEMTDELRPRWGFNRANNPNDEWVIEAKATEKSGADPFTQREQEKKEKVAKNKKQQRRNLEEAGVLPTTVSVNRVRKPGERKPKEDLTKAFGIAQKSTISVGKFDKKLDGEQPVKFKRKFDSVVNDKEQERNAKALRKVLGDEGEYDMNKAANRVIHSQQEERSRQPKTLKPKKKK